MTQKEFIDICKSSGCANADVVRRYVREQGDREYVDDDFVEVFRLNEHLLYLKESAYNPYVHRKHTARDSGEKE